MTAPITSLLKSIKYWVRCSRLRLKNTCVTATAINVYNKVYITLTCGTAGGQGQAPLRTMATKNANPKPMPADHAKPRHPANATKVITTTATSAGHFVCAVPNNNNKVVEKGRQ